MEGFLKRRRGILFTDVALEHMKSERAVDANLMRYFGSLYTSIATLFRTISGGLDWQDAADSLNPLGIFWVQVFQLYVAFVSFAVLNETQLQRSAVSVGLGV